MESSSGAYSSATVSDSSATVSAGGNASVSESVLQSQSRSEAETESEPGSHGTPPGNLPNRRKNLSWSDFQHCDSMDEPASTAESTPPTTLAETADLLRKERTRFLNKVPVDLNSTLCYPPDRSAVILVYDTALSRISANNHLNIYVEAKSKINIIIGLNKVRCTDPAFKQGILPPLEPMYAGPRIEYNKDPYGRHAQWRLNAWRKDRWPLFLPVEAMKRERVMKNRTLEVGEERWKLDEEDWEDSMSGREGMKIVRK
ncbi:hypothetical protein L13192_03545 [Pyrenophora tritici-repentis]|uniref:Uncharacterized protein n=2 Tax=Pyrenophora tritici-repentis TaxID=45151 RepID=A0A922NNU5_9PLEO|nr:uncharacterized protein PTRG_03119 [Pyrenophora tritici-repentis Pt-1C-BFP]EDU45642.1 predicted protein [Pyrenophora tritici-repentis Pt-1C-BFP]KAI1519150.1 hypothetical protein Ptr86124_002278 [Pyrenophora tritici-repentis]KAI1672686.1 hypothetical protein L13192_03545 [Pyrenophora tritici-repentis]KAI1686723.1 hypothetical protein KJE20_04688 [Pyrenophora tritici-repentis]